MKRILSLLVLALIFPAAASADPASDAAAALALAASARPAQAPRTPQAPAVAVKAPAKKAARPCDCGCGHCYQGDCDCGCAIGDTDCGCSKNCPCPSCPDCPQRAARKKTPPCSPLCSCGCQVTGDCTCGSVRPNAGVPARVTYPSPPRFFAPAPFFGGGAMRGGRGGC